jgi:hypothetical protein
MQYPNCLRLALLGLTDNLFSLLRTGDFRRVFAQFRVSAKRRFEVFHVDIIYLDPPLQNLATGLRAKPAKVWLALRAKAKYRFAKTVDVHVVGATDNGRGNA